MHGCGAKRTRSVHTVRGSAVLPIGKTAVPAGAQPAATSAGWALLQATDAVEAGAGLGQPPGLRPGRLV